MISEQQFLEQLRSAIHSNKITLPTLPEVALRVRDALEQEGISEKEIAEIVAIDGALAARLLQVANSAPNRGQVPIESIQQAVARLGNRQARNLVTSLAMQQMFQATSDTLDKQLRAVWEEGVQVGAISKVLAQRLPHLNQEQAMLAGLIHNIGSLPILMLAESDSELIADEARLTRLVEVFNPTIGTEILEEWQFPESLTMVPKYYQQLDYDGGPEADYVDVVLVARLQNLPAGHPTLQHDWSQVPAFSKIGLAPEVEVVNINGVTDELHELKEMFLA